MRRYRTIVEGRNFVLNFDGVTARHGFFQTVFVEAADRAQAEIAAVAHVRGDEDLRAMTLNAADDPPMLYLDSILELPAGEPMPKQPRGRSFFPAKKWWQFWRRK